MTAAEVDNFDNWLMDNAKLIGKHTGPSLICRLWLYHKPTPMNYRFCFTVRRRKLIGDESGTTDSLQAENGGEVVSVLPILGKDLTVDQAWDILRQWGADEGKIAVLMHSL